MLNKNKLHVRYTRPENYDNLPIICYVAYHKGKSTNVIKELARIYTPFLIFRNILRCIVIFYEPNGRAGYFQTEENIA